MSIDFRPPRLVQGLASAALLIGIGWLSLTSAATGAPATFEADYALLGAQRNAKIVGIFTRLAKRDGKPRYLSLIPRVWQAMERDLAHPALAPVAAWFAANIPDHLRAAHGGEVE